MPLIKDGERIDDLWVRARDDEPLPDGAVVVSLPRWQTERARLAQRNTPLGIRLTSSDAVEDIADDLDRFDMIAVEFPAFTDGLPYSTARVLRQRYRYSGELRASGQVLRDQILFMLRCGFDSFEVAKEKDADSWARSAGEFTAAYQPAADLRQPAWAKRTGGMERGNASTTA